jgi:hypothetical protein
MTIEHRAEQGLHSPATREARHRVRRAEGRDARRHIELAYHPQHQRQVGYGTALLTRHRPEAPLRHVFRAAPS